LTGAWQEKCRAALTCDAGKRELHMPNLTLDRPGDNSATTQRELRKSLPTFTVRIEGKPGTAGIRALRAILKTLLRRHGFRCLDA
jgi:hypothetical protein